MLGLSQAELFKFVENLQMMGLNNNTIVVQVIPVNSNHSYIDTLKNYEMDSDDIRKTFGAFGDIVDLKIHS